MIRYKTIVSYNGSNYHGWAKQTNTDKTIQEIIENALEKIYGYKIKIFASGRTDAGVHALQQVFHFDVKEQIIPVNKIAEVINNLLPYDIHVVQIKKTNLNFNARYDVKMKHYQYKINIGKYNSINASTIYQYNKQINLKLLKNVLNKFVGKHDFSSFCTEIKEDSNREIFKVKMSKTKDIVSIDLYGNGFLRSMVRMIVGTLLAINEQKISSQQIDFLFETPKKGASTFKAPSCGLYLYKVKY